MDDRKKTKAVFITEIISPYRIPVFNEIAEDERIDFKVFFLAETEPERSWGVEKGKIRFHCEVLPGFRFSLPDRFPVFLNPSIASRLEAADPDVVVSGGYHHPSSFLALFYARRNRKRFLLWCESHQESIRFRGFPFSWYRDSFIHTCDGFIVPGRKSLDFIHGFGVNGKRIQIAPNAVDNEFFSREAETSRHKARPDRFPSKVILYVGRLADSKGIQTLLQAFRGLLPSLDAGLVLVGEGKDKRKYQDFCRRHGLKNVFFEGFKQQEELPFYYGLADLFVLPSYREEWGLVLNEAAASGLPLIATDVSGASADLIENHKNGFLVPKNDASALVNHMARVLKDKKLSETMGKFSREKASQFSPEKCAKGFVQAVVETAQKL